MEREDLVHKSVVRRSRDRNRKSGNNNTMFAGFLTPSRASPFSLFILTPRPRDAYK